ncbi:hypothetical protein WJX81_001268 [Elliptochloris bilobata]|uniref:Dymeclin n=1 Tax=Elliptochloris bilobata TaxID=381761 RepID=A0AAW1SII4_9CHLO
MGGGGSKPDPGAHDRLLAEFSGTMAIDISDLFWTRLLQFPTPLTQLPPAEVEAATAYHCEELVRHNQGTQHLQKLLHHTVELLHWVDKRRSSAAEATNALVFTRVVMKHLAESLTGPQLADFVNAPLAPASEKAAAPKAPPLVTQLVRELATALLIVECSVETYLLHWELLNALLVLASTQLYTPNAGAVPGAHPFTEALLGAPDLVPALVQVLLEHFIEQAPLPPGAPVYVPPAPAAGGAFRFARSAASAATSVLLLPVRAVTYMARAGSGGSAAAAASPIADTAQLLLLVLLHHAPAGRGGHAFRQALRALQDASDAGDEAAAEAGQGGAAAAAAAEAPAAARVPYPALYEAVGRGLEHERGVLLLYDLLHGCPHFQDYVLVRGDLETVLLPLLRLLYTAGGRHSPSHMYMLLIILLILSQDAAFAANVHAVQLVEVPWYKERLLHKTSLGSLLVILLLRTAHYNLAALRDVYLHTNTLAALANLAPYAHNLSSLAAQRLVSLFDMLARRYRQLAAACERGEPRSEELQVYADFLRIVLEILNTVITAGLPQNPELVYALLHRQEVFAPFQADARFAELMENVGTVLAHFNERVEAVRATGGWDWSVARVLEVIKDSLRAWRGDKLRQFPELRFTYEEEASPEDFFVPMVWTLVVAHTSVPWNPQVIALFSPVSAEEAEGNGGLPGSDSLSASEQAV